jgi:hypothetical protein
MAFIPNQDCLVSKANEETDEFGQPTFAAPVEERCAIVKLDLAREKTSVRVDSSGSRGNAQEFTANARILFTRDSIIAVGDKVEILGNVLRALSKFPRHDIGGSLDHYQVDLEIWQD